MRQHFPLTTRSLHVEDAIENKSENQPQPDDQTLWVQAQAVSRPPTLRHLSHWGKVGVEDGQSQADVSLQCN